MSKFIYVGCPKDGPNKQKKVSYTGPAGETVTFVADQPTETPEWLAARLAKSNHFKEVKPGRPPKAEAEG